MSSGTDDKAILHGYLRVQRDHLLAKLSGLGEREIRWPMTPTATNLLGIVKHVASVQLGYFGEVFGRPADRSLPWLAEGAEVNADMWATASETRQEKSTSTGTRPPMPMRRSSPSIWTRPAWCRGGRRNGGT